jgi:hypothetical protein
MFRLPPIDGNDIYNLLAVIFVIGVTDLVKNIYLVHVIEYKVKISCSVTEMNIFIFCISGPSVVFMKRCDLP